MTSDWARVSLGQVVDILTGFPFKSEHYVDDSEAPRLLRGDNIAQGTLRWDGVKRWPLSQAEDLKSYWLIAGDVVLAMDRPWIDAGLKYASIREVDLPVLLVQRVARLRGTEKLDGKFLRYIIASRAFTEYVLAVQTGTAVPHISSGQIKGFQFSLPPTNEQRAIAHILGTLDDKIELNQRMSETLEGIARVLFKSWFVDFDPVRARAEGRDSGLPSKVADLFPSSLQDSEIGKIPRGWTIQGIDQIARFLNGLASQKFPPKDDRSLPVIKIAQLRTGTTEGADLASADLDPDFIVEDGDVLFSWSGSLECVLWAGGRGALNQHLFKVTSQYYPKWFYYLWIHQHLAAFRHIAAAKATTMGHIQRHHLSEARVVSPDLALLNAADKLIGPLIESILRRRIQSFLTAETSS
jgi:type I restriction enzyme S subunit